MNFQKGSVASELFLQVNLHVLEYEKHTVEVDRILAWLDDII
jgi:hypothetical protein